MTFGKIIVIDLEKGETVEGNFTVEGVFTVDLFNTFPVQIFFFFHLEQDKLIVYLKKRKVCFLRPSGDKIVIAI